MFDVLAEGQRRLGMVIDYRVPAATAKLVQSEHETEMKVVARQGIGKK